MQALAACLAAFASPVWACPGPDDLAVGIRIDLAGEDFSIITKGPDGVIREVEYLVDLGEPVTYVTENGVLETAYLSPSEEESAFYSYDFPTDEILPLKEWAGQAGKQIERDATGKIVGTLGFSWRTRGMEAYTIGECTYDAIPLETLYDDEMGTSMTEFRYLVELGIPVVVGFYMHGTADLYPPVKISAVEE